MDPTGTATGSVGSPSPAALDDPTVRVAGHDHAEPLAGSLSGHAAPVALALELAPVRVNVIRPGYTDSEMWSSVSERARVAA